MPQSTNTWIVPILAPYGIDHDDMQQIMSSLEFCCGQDSYAMLELLHKIMSYR